MYMKKNNTKLMKRIISIAPECLTTQTDGDIFDFETGKDRETGAVTTCTGSLDSNLVTYNDLIQKVLPGTYIKMGFSITPFDRAVMDAIYTIWSERLDKKSNICNMAYSDIYKYIMGGSRYNLTKEIIYKLKYSVLKLRCIDAWIYIGSDFPKVAKYFDMEEYAEYDKAEATLRSALINCVEFIITRKNGTKSDGIQLLNCPVLYLYAQAIEQIIGVEDSWLQVPGRFSNKTLAIRDYLINYIRGLDYCDEDFAPWVKYKTIFLSAGIVWEDNDYAPSKNRKSVDKMLDYYKKIGVIKDYELSDDKSKVKIIPAKNKKK